MAKFTSSLIQINVLDVFLLFHFMHLLTLKELDLNVISPCIPYNVTKKKSTLFKKSYPCVCFGHVSQQIITWFMVQNHHGPN